MPASWIRSPRWTSGARLVLEQRRREPVELGRARERIARDGDVVVPEHDVRVQAAQRLVEAGAAPGMREQVAGDDDEVGVPLAHPVRGPANGDGAARGRAEVEVGEVRDPQPVERGGQPRDRHLEHARAQPARLEPAVSDRQRCHDGAGDHDPGSDQARRPPGSPGPKPPLQS